MHKWKASYCIVWLYEILGVDKFRDRIEEKLRDWRREQRHFLIVTQFLWCTTFRSGNHCTKWWMWLILPSCKFKMVKIVNIMLYIEHK